MRRRPQRPDRIVPPGWRDWDDDDPEPVAGPIGCAVMAVGFGGLLAMLVLVSVLAWQLVM